METTRKDGQTGPIARYVQMCVKAAPIACDEATSARRSPVDIALTAAMLGLAYFEGLSPERTDALLSRALDSELRDAAVMLDCELTSIGRDWLAYQERSAAARSLIDAGLAEAHAAAAA